LPRAKAKGADPKSGQQRRPLTERDHPGMAGEIISEHRATSNRKGGRHHPGFASDLPPKPHSPPSRTPDGQKISNLGGFELTVFRSGHAQAIPEPEGYNIKDIQ